MTITAEAPASVSLERVTNGPLLEVAAAPMFFAADFISTRHGGLEAVKASPADDGVLLEAIGPTAAVQLEISGSCEAPVLVPGRILQLMRSRHGDAELMAVKRIDDVHLSVRSFSDSCTVAMNCAEPLAPLPPFPSMASDDATEGRPLRIDPKLLQLISGRLAALRGVDVAVLQHSWGLQFRVSGDGLRGQVMLLGMTAGD